MENASQTEFGRMRRYLWPIHRQELKKLIPMLLMSFLIAFAYNVLRNMKDSLIVTAESSGAEAIPFVKVWCMFPMAILLTTIFVKLSHRFSAQAVFYIMISCFLSFFSLFTFVFYPLRDYLHPHGFADYLESILPLGFKGFVAMIRYWTFSLFYAFSEVWGVINLSILFWGFANEVTKVTEAKRFYGLFGLGANVSAIFSGKVSYFLCHRSFNPNWPIGEDIWHQSLILLTLSILISGVAVMLLFHWFQIHVVSKMQISSNSSQEQLAKLTSKPSMKESFAALFKSKYLITIAVIVISYNLFINLVEVLWKDQVKQLHPNSNDYNLYMSDITFITGIIATILAMFVSGNMIRKFGWTATAMLTPIILVASSVGFFGFYFFPQDAMAVLTSLLGITPLAMVVFFGSAQNCLSRASKYTVFDATKELSFIPLKREDRVKGKAAIDGVSSRLGKSGGALIYQGLLMVCGSLPACAPYVACWLLVVLSGWMLAVRSLGRQFNRKIVEQGLDDVAARPARRGEVFAKVPVQS